MPRLRPGCNRKTLTNCPPPSPAAFSPLPGRWCGKAITYIFAIHVPIAGMSLLPALFQWPLVLLPVHILFLELIIDPACSTIFEAEKAEPNLMRRRPRDQRQPLFSRRSIGFSDLQPGGAGRLRLARRHQRLW
jgi:hypothetical protein